MDMSLEYARQSTGEVVMFPSPTISRILSKNSIAYLLEAWGPLRVGRGLLGDNFADMMMEGIWSINGGSLMIAQPPKFMIAYTGMESNPLRTDF
jgi:hypothetical protein